MESNLSKEFTSLLINKCTSLIQINKIDAALMVYKHFFNILQERGFFILVEMLNCNYVSYINLFGNILLCVCFNISYINEAISTYFRIVKVLYLP